MQQRSEPYTLALARRGAHGDESVRRGVPAQCPGRGRLAAVSLGRGPSLHGLRRGQALFVRSLLGYYNPVRILIRVHVHRSAVAFMNRPGLPVRTRMRLPRFRAKNFSTCTRSPTARGSSHASHLPWDDVAFSSTERDRHLGIRPVSQLNTWPVVSPVNASRRPSRDAAHHSGSGRMASPYPMGDSHLLFFASFPGALRVGSNYADSLCPSNGRSRLLSPGNCHSAIGPMQSFRTGHLNVSTWRNSEVLGCPLS